MFLICPLIAAIALFETFCILFLISKSLFVISLIAIGLFLYIRKALKNAKLNFILSWLFQQFYLISGLILISKKMRVWKSAERGTK